MAVFSFSSNIGKQSYKASKKSDNKRKNVQAAKRTSDANIQKSKKTSTSSSSVTKAEIKEESAKIYNHKLRKISGVAFLDKFYDSTYYKFSTGINDLELRLYDEDDNLLSVTMTKKFMYIDGYFEFNNLYPGKYKIEIMPYEDLAISPILLKEYYGSKANSKNNTISFYISDRNISNAFIGFYQYT